MPEAAESLERPTTPRNPIAVSPSVDSNGCLICLDLPHGVAAHCTRCHSSWTRTSNAAHCMTCHRTFATPGVFDRHLKPVSQDGCNDPATVVRRSGDAVYGEARANKWGTDVWHLAGRPPERP